MRVLIAGCGYVGMALGRRLVSSGHEVFGIRRSPDQTGEMAQTGIIPVQADLSDKSTFQNLPRHCPWLVFCAASGGGDVAAYEQTYLQGISNLLEWLKSTATPVSRFVYTSSTSVYGQMDGSWVDETAETAPVLETSRVLLAAEKLLLEADRKSEIPAVILRVAGIYGPGRGYWLKQFLDGAIAYNPSELRILNMIHREDVAGVIQCALEKGKPGEIYNASDDEPVELPQLQEWLSQHTGKKLSAPESEPSLAVAPRKRGVSNKKTSNRKLKTQLGYVFRFPSYREGMAEELKSHSWSASPDIER
jgi:nucleoside-diphosphate-sugar epimerase